MVFVAIDPSFTILDKDEIPETKEKNTSGTTIKRSKFLNIWPPRLKKRIFPQIKKFAAI